MHPGWRKRRDKGRRGRDRDRVVLCSVSLLLVSEFGGKGDGVWEGPRGRGRSNVPLPGLPLFPAFFGNDVTLCVHPGDPGALGLLLRALAEGSGGRQDGSGVCCCPVAAVPWVSPDTGDARGGSRAAGLSVPGQAEPVTPAGIPPCGCREMNGSIEAGAGSCRQKPRGSSRIRGHWVCAQGGGAGSGGP